MQFGEKLLYNFDMFPKTCFVIFYAEATVLKEVLATVTYVVPTVKCVCYQGLHNTTFHGSSNRLVLSNNNLLICKTIKAAMKP